MTLDYAVRAAVRASAEVYVFNPVFRSVCYADWASVSAVVHRSVYNSVEDSVYRSIYFHIDQKINEQL
jgi:hypothetical protein